MNFLPIFFKTRLFFLFRKQTRFPSTGKIAFVALALSLRADDAVVPLEKMTVSPSHTNVAESDVTAGPLLSSGDLEIVPQIGDDLFRSINRLLGVTADDFAAKVWMRGAPNSEVRTRLDGVDLIEPYHLKDYDGAVSIVDLQTTSSVETITGGFTGEYGNVLAGVVNVSSKRFPSGNRSNRLSVNLLNLSLSSARSPDPGHVGWLASFRQGLPDLALKSVHEDQTLSPRYYDLMAKLEYQLTPRHALSLHMLHAHDRLKVQPTGDPELRSSSSDTYVWGRWQGSFGDRLSGDGVIAVTRLDRDRLGLGKSELAPFSLHDQRGLGVYSARQDWNLSVSNIVLFRGGVEGSWSASKYRYSIQREVNTVENGGLVVRPDHYDASLDPKGAHTGGYLAVRWRPLGRVTVEPSLRFDQQSYTHESEWSPRFNAAWSIGGGTLRAAWGIYFQAQGLHELNLSDRDAFFYGAERAEHRVLSFEREITQGLSFRLEAYERDSSRLRPRWLNFDDPYNAFPEIQPDRIKLTPTAGRARGLEFSLHGKPSRVLSWNASYALARSEEKAFGKWIPRGRDQRHTVQLDASYAPSKRWQFSAAWHYHTGWPFSETSYQLVPLADGSHVIVGSLDAPFSLRLPAYHRLDLRVTRQFYLQRGRLSAYLDLFNAYNRSNLIGYNRKLIVTETAVEVMAQPRKLFPFLPTAGLSWEF